MTPAWIRSKSAALATAWGWLYGAAPPLHAVALALTPAWHETLCGDRLNGNWGACILRRLTDAEESVLVHAGLHATVGPDHEAVAAQAQAALEASGLPLPRGRIHCDSEPTPEGQCPYFCWFPDFEDDASAAAYYLGVLAGIAAPRSARAVLLDPAGTVAQLATYMYSQHYYAGFAPHGGPGDQRNIDAYAGACQKLYPDVVAALDGWTAPEATARPVRNLLLGDTGEDVRRMQDIVRAPSSDGDFGPKTLAAVDAWKVAHALPADGVWDDACRAAYNAAPSDRLMQRLSSVQFADWRPDAAG